jgi:formyltetrahydrofolate-dependent phosphoribosylglycinamide formyltransferase
VKPLSLAVLVSGTGRSLQNLIDLAEEGRLPARIVHVIGSRAGIAALERAARHGIPTTVCGPESLTALLDRIGPDLVVMAGYLKHWPIPDRWVGKAINIHPALLPEFGGKGLYGSRVHEAVLAAGKKTSGCTVHFVTSDYDAGPPILQRTGPVMPGDTPDTLAARVFAEELIALPEAIARIARGGVTLE